jgi:cytochrome b pre-mRNA-processing protein 3
MGIWPFRRSRAKADAERLLAVVSAAARQPAWYGEGKIPDTLEGRFEAMAVNASLALQRLKADPAAGGLAQLFTDMLFSTFDAGLREAGVGDLTVPKRMHKLAGDFYGRAEAYGRALEGAPGEFEAALERNLGVSGTFAARLASHLRMTAELQAAAPVTELSAPASWPLFAG